MLFYFLALISCQDLQRPLICIHGFGGIQTDAELTGQVSKCLTEKKTIHIYELDKDIYQKYPDCISYFLEVNIDENNRVYQNPNFTLNIPNILSPDKSNPFTSLSGYLQDRKYTLDKDLISFTYNWFLYPVGTPEIFSQLQERVEKAHKESGKKVVLLGHSYGTHVIRQFITNAMDEKWVQKHIDGVIFSAPAFVGCFGPFDFFVKGQFSSLPITEYSTFVTRKMPSIHAMFPNYVAYKDEVIFSNVTNAGDVKASQLRDFFVKNGFLSKDAEKIFNLVEPSLNEKPKQPPVRSLVLYNSAMNAIVGYNGDDYQPIYGPGDGICQSSGPEYACKNWENIQCVDWNKVGDDWSHDNMLHRIQELDEIYNFLTEGDGKNNKKNNKSVIYVLIGVASFEIVVAIVLVIVILLVMKRTNSGSRTMTDSLITN